MQDKLQRLPNPEVVLGGDMKNASANSLADKPALRTIRSAEVSSPSNRGYHWFRLPNPILPFAYHYKEKESLVRD